MRSSKITNLHSRNLIHLGNLFPKSFLQKSSSRSMHVRITCKLNGFNYFTNTMKFVWWAAFAKLAPNSCHSCVAHDIQAWISIVFDNLFIASFDFPCYRPPRKIVTTSANQPEHRAVLCTFLSQWFDLFLFLLLSLPVPNDKLTFHKSPKTVAYALPFSSNQLNAGKSAPFGISWVYSFFSFPPFSLISHSKSFFCFLFMVIDCLGSSH